MKKRGIIPGGRERDRVRKKEREILNTIVWTLKTEQHMFLECWRGAEIEWEKQRERFQTQMYKHMFLECWREAPDAYDKTLINKNHRAHWGMMNCYATPWSVWCSSCPPCRQKAKWTYDNCIYIYIYICRRRERNDIWSYMYVRFMCIYSGER